MGNTLGPQIWTPGSDYTLGSSDSQILLTRDGNDNIITYDPGADSKDRLKIDILLGDLEFPGLAVCRREKLDRVRSCQQDL